MLKTVADWCGSQYQLLKVEFYIVNDCAKCFIITRYRSVCWPDDNDSSVQPIGSVVRRGLMACSGSRLKSQLTITGHWSTAVEFRFFQLIFIPGFVSQDSWPCILKTDDSKQSQPLFSWKFRWIFSSKHIRIANMLFSSDYVAVALFLICKLSIDAHQ